MRTIVLGAVAVAASALSADSLVLRLRGDNIFVSAAKLDLLRPRLLNRLKSGNTVTYDFHLALWVGTRNTAHRRSFERFVVSYDLWEEKFAVTNLRKPRATVAGLAPGAVANWCLGNMSLSAPGLKTDDRLWVKLEVRAVEPQPDPDPADNEVLNLNTLIEIFSRTARAGEDRWSVEAGPLRFGDLQADARMAERDRLP